MARSMLRKGRMLQEDEDKIQRCTAFIEREVEAKELTTHLYSAKILDFNDRSEIDGGETRVWRVRRLLEMLIMRGPYAYHEFSKALKREGYDHILGRLEDCCELDLEVERGKDDTDVRVASLGSSSESRLSRIEDLLDQLCQRVMILESSDEHRDIPEDEISDLKHQVIGLKTHTMTQIKDLIEESSKKDEKIADLTSQLEEKEQKLLEAEQRILELEGRIQDLESQCTRYKRDIDHLKKQERIQADRLQRQERKVQTQAESLKRQEKNISDQERKLLRQQEQIQDGETRMSEMNVMMSKMASTLETVQNNLVNDGRIRVIGRNMPNMRNRVKPRGK